MRRKRLRALAWILLAGGVCTLLFPAVSNYIGQREMDREADEYQARAEAYRNDSSGDLAELYEAIQSYNQSLYLTGQAELKDPFSYEQPSFDLTRFGLRENIIGVLDIPKIGLHMPVYLGASSESMKKGAAHLTQTSLPVGGENTNAVIAGHRGMATKKMFRDLHKLNPGDEVTVTNLWETLHYHVTEIQIIAPTDVEQILIQPGRDMVTLLSCHPIGYNARRYIVYCERAAQ